MKYLGVLFAFVLVLTVASAEDEESKTVVLTTENFYEVTRESDVLVKFYAPWCSHCKKLAPIFDEAAEKVEGKIRVAKIDCTSYSPICDRYEVKGYPTLKFFRDGEPRDFKGRRTVDSIVEYADRMIADPVQETDAQTVKVMLTMPERVRFVFFGKKGPMREAYWLVARTYQGGSLLFLESQSASVGEALGVSADKNTLTVIKDGKVAEYDGEFTYDALNAWIIQERHPVIRELKSDSFDDAIYGGKLAMITLLTQPESKPMKKYLETVKAVSKKMRHKFVTSYLNADTKEGNQFAGQFDLKNEQLPRVVVLDAPRDIHYTQDPESTNAQEDILDFLDRVLAGEVDAQGPGASFGNKLYEYYKQHKSMFHIAGAFVFCGFMCTLIAACIAIIRADDDEEGADTTHMKKE